MNKKKVVFTFRWNFFVKFPVLFALIAISCGYVDSSKKTDIDNLIYKTMQENRLPSLSTAISYKGELVFSGAKGYSDLENKTLASTKSVYRIGSISKSITATMLMMLKQEGKLDINTPVGEYCKEFQKKGPPITSKQLMSHLAGIRHYDFGNIETEYYSLKRYSSSAEALEIFKEDSLVAPPGSKYHYSSYGYSILGCVIESVENTSFQSALLQNIFDKTGMDQSTVDFPEQIVQHRTRPYETLEDGTWENARPVDLSNKFPGGGILSTPTDLVKFGNKLLEKKLLNPELLEEMWEPQFDKDGKPINYALGWRISDDESEVYHGGSSAGGTAYLYIQPKKNLVIAFTCNSGDWHTSRHEFVQQLAGFFDEM